MVEDCDLMVEDEKSIVDPEEMAAAKKLLGFNNFKLSEDPVWDLKRKLVLGRILPLLMIGKTYDEISTELNVGRSRVYEILKIYYKVCDQNELVDTYWWGLFFWARKNKPELAFNALTQIKLKRMMLSAPVQTEEIIIKWMTDEQNSGSNDKLQASSGPETDARVTVAVSDAALRKTLGQNEVGR